MDLQTAKIELTKLILSIENPTIIEKIKDLLINETSKESYDMAIAEKLLNKVREYLEKYTDLESPILTKTKYKPNV